MARRAAAIRRTRIGIEDLVRTAQPIAEFGEQLTELLQPVIPHAAACVLTTDPGSRLLTSTHKFGGLLGNHALDGLWAQLEYGTDDPTRMATLALAKIPAAATSLVPGGIDRSPRMRELVRPGGFGDELRVVARHDGAAWGGLNLFRASDEAPFDRHEVAIMAALSGTVATGLRTALIARSAPLAEDDSPTGPAVLITDEHANLCRISASAALLIDEFSGSSRRSPLDSVIHGLVDAVTRSAPLPAEGLATARLQSPTGRWLVAHAARLPSEGGTGEVVVTISEARPPEIVPLLTAAFGLTPREGEVMHLALAGFTTRSIAKRLAISVHTAQDHFKAIFEKAGVQSRQQLAARVFFDQYAPRLGSEVTASGWFASV